MNKAETFFLKSIETLSILAEEIGIFTFLRFFSQKKVIILMYHGITAKSEPIINFDYKQVEKQKFEKHIAYLKENYSIVSLEEFLAWKTGERNSLPRNPVILTFDDGYKNCYSQLFPLIKKYNVSTTIFLPTAYIGKKEIAWYDKATYCIAETKKQEIHLYEKIYSLETKEQKKAGLVEIKRKISLMPEKRREFLKDMEKQTGISSDHCQNEDLLFISWEQCKEMSEEKISFGSHSIDHEFMTDISSEKIKEELEESKKTIEKRLNILCLAFAYPFGKTNAKIEKMMQEAGYRCGLTTAYGKNTKQTEMSTLRRIVITNRYSLPIFKLTLFFNFPAFHHEILMIWSKLLK